jgi:DNA-binding protein Fis
MIRAALKRAGGVQTRAAESLGISERALRYKLKKYGLEG